MESTPIKSRFNLKLNRRQTQHAYYFASTMLSAFELKSAITEAVLAQALTKYSLNALVMLKGPDCKLLLLSIIVSHTIAS